MVRPDVAGKKVARAEAWLDEAEALLGRPSEEFLSDLKGRDLASFYLMLAVQECIDLAAHWVADEGWGPPEDAASTFDILADRETLDPPLADRLRGAVGLRNRIAHGYAMLDHGRLQNEFSNGVADLRRFLALVSAQAGL